MASPQRLHRPRQGDDGLSIIGVVIASFIIMVALPPAASLLQATIAVSGDNQHRVVAANLATQQLEKVRNQIAVQGFANWVTSYGLSSTTNSAPVSTLSQTVGTTAYSVATNIAWSVGAFQTGGCASVTAEATAAPPLLEVFIKVTWPNDRLAQPVTLAASINAPSSLFNVSDGSVLVSVIGAGGSTDPQTGVVVNLSSTTFGPTDATGCYFFPSVTPGNYTTQVYSNNTQNIGYVNQAGQTIASQTITVSKGVTAGVQFIYDKGAYFSVTDSTQSSIASGFGLVASDAYLTQTPKISPLQLTASGTPATYGPVFPNSAGYQTWLGACSANQFKPNASYLTSAATSPATTTSLSGLLYSTLDLTLVSGSPSLPESNASVDVYVWQYTSASAACNATPVKILVKTNALGQAPIQVPVGYFELAAGLPSDPQPGSPTTTSIIDATNPKNPVLVSNPISVS